MKTSKKSYNEHGGQQFQRDTRFSSKTSIKERQLQWKLKKNEAMMLKNQVQTPNQSSQ